MCILFRSSSDDNYRSSRLAAIEGNEVNDSVKFHIGHGLNNEFNAEDLNLIDMEPEEIRVIYIFLNFIN